jgi:L-ribulose-5-phosphate 3-epimerase
MKFNYGVMQGRLSKKVNNKIQAFPEKDWKKEFLKAKKLGLKLIEWTLDYKKFYNNPVFTDKGQQSIKKLQKKYSIKIESLTGDCFMQKPFWKTSKNSKLISDFKNLIKACNKLKIKFIVVPLVDNGSLKSLKEEIFFINICKDLSKFIEKNKVIIVFESDYHPKKLKKFISKFDKKLFGINYDVGNSAGLNYDISDEFNLYGNRILNIHIKDRIKHGKTVRLGEGNADFKKLFNKLKNINYKGNLILQTARSKNNKDIDEIKINLRYLNNLKKRTHV